jgi:1-acyl-sn-glycerol-3-phosphate acyltransferase
MSTRFSEDYFTTASAARLRSRFPSLFFYPGMIRIVLDAAALARKGLYGNEQWVGSSRRIIDLLESVGVRMAIENVRVLEKIGSPCVFIGNHMSTLETFVLPCILQPYLPVTFVIKRRLAKRCGVPAVRTNAWSGKEEQTMVVRFIQENLERWTKEES